MLTNWYIKERQYIPAWVNCSEDFLARLVQDTAG
jgi:hypothetical protein